MFECSLVDVQAHSHLDPEISLDHFLLDHTQQTRQIATQIVTFHLFFKAISSFFVLEASMCTVMQLALGQRRCAALVASCDRVPVCSEPGGDSLASKILSICAYLQNL